MAIPAARLYIRVRLEDGSRPYLDPIFAKNGKLKPLHAVIDGKPVHRPDGVYYIRYLRSKKRVFERVGTDANLGHVALTKRNSILDAMTLPSEPVPLSRLVLEDFYSSSSFPRPHPIAANIHAAIFASASVQFCSNCIGLT